jgi:hypothetical protein
MWILLKKPCWGGAGAWFAPPLPTAMVFVQACVIIKFLGSMKVMEFLYQLHTAQCRYTAYVYVSGFIMWV